MKSAMVVVAGGSGRRMQRDDLPKQFIELEGKPILLHTIAAIRRWREELPIVLVLPQKQMALWQSIWTRFAGDLAKPILVPGGATRTESVSAGLKALEHSDTECVGIHDGVRPCLSEELLERLFSAVEANRSGAALPVVPCTDSLRLLSEDREGLSSVLDRSRVRCVQTPQVFRYAPLWEAYRAAASSDEIFTDDASVWEWFHGEAPLLLEGALENIKITTPKDLVLAASLLKERGQ